MKGMMVPLLVLLMTGTVFGLQETPSADLPGRLVLELGDADLDLLRTSSQGLQAIIPEAPDGLADKVQLRHNRFRTGSESLDPAIHVWWLSDDDIYRLRDLNRNLTDDIPEATRGKIVQVMLEYDTTPPPAPAPAESPAGTAGGGFRGGQLDNPLPPRTAPPASQTARNGGAFGGTGGTAEDRFNNERERMGQRRTDTTINDPVVRTNEPIWPDRAQQAPRTDAGWANRGQTGALPRDAVDPRDLVDPRDQPGTDAFANERLRLETQRILDEREADRLAQQRQQEQAYASEADRARRARERLDYERRLSQQLREDRFASSDSLYPSDTTPIGYENGSITPEPASYEQFQMREYDPTPMPRRERLARNPSPTQGNQGSISDLSATFPPPQNPGTPVSTAGTNGANNPDSNNVNQPLAGQINNPNVLDESQKARSWGLLFTMLLCSIGLNIYLAWISRGFYVRYHELADELRETFTASM
ncbi:MAG: hypothetical protein AAF456_02305 [Planctomycetota bacterium]